MKYYYTYDTKLGKISIEGDNNYITKIVLGNYNGIKKETSLIKKCYIEIKEYLDGKRVSFTVPIKYQGTPFQEKVWKELLNIPYGEIITYKELARRVGNIKAVRAVGTANHKNPIPIIIPCHRVIGSNQKLVGYLYGLDKKEYLLNLEKVVRND